MKRHFRLALTILCMLAVMFISAAITLRIALHGHEVTVPDFAGMTVGEASKAALHASVDLVIENKYYSTTVPAGRVLSQAPAAGSRVRHGWSVRVTESLGPQQVTIPDVAGEPVREASIDIRRMSLDLGTLAHIDAPGDADMVLAQTPPPNAGVDQPRVSLLLSSSAATAQSSFVLPSFVGMSWPAANHAAIALGLKVAATGQMWTPPAPSAAPATPSAPAAGGTAAQPATNAPGAAASSGQTAAAGPSAATPAPSAAPVPVGPVTSQTPEAGHRASRGDTIRLNFGHPASQSSAEHQ